MNAHKAFHQGRPDCPDARYSIGMIIREFENALKEQGVIIHQMEVDSEMLEKYGMFGIITDPEDLKKLNEK